MGVIKSDGGFGITFISFFLYMDLVGGESRGAHVNHCAVKMHPADLSHIIILSVILAFVRTIEDAKARSAFSTPYQLCSPDTRFYSNLLFQKKAAEMRSGKDIDMPVDL